MTTSLSVCRAVEVLESRIAPAAVPFVNLGALNGTNGFQLSGDVDGDRLGHAVSDAGDVNGDDFGDFIVGAPNSDPDSLGSGASYVVFGQADGFPAALNVDALNGTNGFKIRGVEIDSYSGSAVSAAGDVNDDGFDDVIVGAGDAAGGASNSAGASYVIFGKAGAFSAAVDATALNGYDGFAIFGEADGDHSGYAVGAAGDVNGDGIDDVIVGARGASPNGAQSGASYVVFGRTNFVGSPFPGFALLLADLDGTDGFQINGIAMDDKSGHSVNGAGDVNGDGFDDVIIGAPSEGPGQDGPGAAFIVFGRSTFVVSPTPGFAIELSALDGSTGLRLGGINDGDRTGRSASGAGDVNGDGFDDVMLGAHEGGAGRAFVVYGKADFVIGATPGFTIELESLDGTNGFRVDGEASTPAAGRSVSAAGDVNGDGFDDIIIGAPDHDDEPTRGAGAAYVIFGRAGVGNAVVKLSSLNGSTGFKLRGVGAGDATGYAVSAAGDVNGDGFADLLVGAYAAGDEGAAAGACYVVFGMPGVQTNPSTIVVVEPDGDIVTVTLGGGTLTPQDITRAEDGSIAAIDLTRFAALAQAAGGNPLNLTLGVKTPNASTGDGFAKVGLLNAAGVNLGKVKLAGSLDQLQVGFGDAALKALKSLFIKGNLGGSGGTTLESGIEGGLGKLTIKGGLLHASLNVTGKLGKLSIAGDFDGRVPDMLAPGPVSSIGTLQAGSFGNLRIGGNFLGGAIVAGGAIGRMLVGGDFEDGSLSASTGIKSIKVLGNMRSTVPAEPVVITARERLGALFIDGDVENARILVGYNKDQMPVNADARAGRVVVKGSWTAASFAVGIDDTTGDGFGRNDEPIAGDTTPGVLSKIASIVIKGTAMGSTAAGDHFGITAQQVGKLSIAGTPVALTDELDDLSLDETNADFRVVEIGVVM